MRIALIIVAGLLGLLSIGAGAAKIALVPEEVAFLDQFGSSEPVVIVFGAVQVLGGVLLLFPRSRAAGAVISGVAFLISSGLLLVAGNVVFAAVSLIPVVLAFTIFFRKSSARTEVPGAESGR